MTTTISYMANSWSDVAITTIIMVGIIIAAAAFARTFVYRK